MCFMSSAHREDIIDSGKEKVLKLGREGKGKVESEEGKQKYRCVTSSKNNQKLVAGVKGGDGK